MHLSSKSFEPLGALLKELQEVADGSGIGKHLVLSSFL